MKKGFCILIIFSILASCEEEIDKQYGTNVPLRLVVEGMVSNQPGESYVKLKLSQSDPNDQVVNVSGAIITISDDKKTINLIEDTSETGTYRPEIGLRGVIGKKYKILIQIGNFKDSATTTLIPVSPLNIFKTQADGSRPGYFFISSENNGDPAIIQYIIDQPGCSGEADCRNVIYEYILNSFDVPQIFSPEKETRSYPKDSKVIRKKYSLNPEYEAYIRAVLSETEWRGGLFDVQAGNPQGNFGKFTLGYFAGCSLVIDTVLIQ